MRGSVSRDDKYECMHVSGRLSFGEGLHIPSH